ncbi:serine hydrolase domain-containing protein [Paractinoplanes durhamensis]|uniref:Serine hydrolase n=1 Tax=Paractinoplanes durhamensis TaxID=113563 RepID=A0ABQ3YNQ1_9ACTN|nr:serine hydrolase domain-containing protein [Actinoplanes durhamensis]GID99180.1 serine hydrolase [Actinoplanes durhamensis]
MSALRDAIAARVDRGEFPGVVALVARDDEVVVHTVGVTRVGGDVPMRRDTPFRIASMTKPVLAAVTLMLAEDDRLDLEEPVVKLLPELAGQRVLRRPDGPLDDTVELNRPVTVADLLTFTFGFGMIVEDGQIDPPYPIVQAGRDLDLVLSEPYPPTPHDPDEWIRRFGTLPLMNQPGEVWRYNAGTLVLGVLLARAAGQPLDELLHERIFAPLGMTHTGFWLPADRAAELPTCYMTDPATGVLAEQDGSTAATWTERPVFPSGSGGLVSTADDYLAFARFLLDGGVVGGTRLLSKQSVAAMTTNHLAPEQIEGTGFLDGQGWGYGMSVTVKADEVSGPGRYGWSGGYGTDWFNDPGAGLTVILLSQVTDLLWNGALQEFSRLAYAPD